MAQGARYGEGEGWLVFAAIMLMVVGFFYIIWGFAAIVSDPFVVTGTDETVTVIGDINAWGWVMLIIGVVEIAAGFGVLSLQQWARWFGIIVAALAALGHIGSLRAFPIWSLIVIGISVLIIYGLATYGGREGRPAVG